MKIFIIVFLTFLISSCGMMNLNGRDLRLVKVAKKEVAILERTNSVSISDHKELNHKNILSTDVAVSIDTTAETTDRTDVFNKVEIQNKPLYKTDLKSDIENPDDESTIVDQALRAERNASTSMIFAIIGTIISFLPFVFYISLIPFIIGLIFYSKANSSRYITPFGEKRLRSSKILLILNGIVLLLWLIVIIALIAIFW